ncbi:hypothetical protein MRX96_025619 [Rhipicephalus microplus]
MTMRRWVGKYRHILSPGDKRPAYRYPGAHRSAQSSPLSSYVQPTVRRSVDSLALRAVAYAATMVNASVGQVSSKS